ncbi:MAG TPA: hypothetical protein DEQ43_23325 [Nocardioides bacterium]|nr:hypothetical protein [Nocardioides sp.]
MEQVDPWRAASAAPLLVDLLDDRAERRQTGAAGHEQQITRVASSQGQPLPHGGPELDTVPALEGPHDRRTHLAAVDLLDVEIDRAVGAGALAGLK